MKVFNRVTSKHFSTKDDAPGRSWFVSVGKISLLLISTIILTLGLSISFQSLLASWTAPVANPPTCTLGNPGCDSPIGSGTTLLQSMQGGLWVVNSAYPTSPYGLIVENGNVGIGTVSPSQKLDLIGNLELENTISADTGVIYKGVDRFIHNFKHPTGSTAVPDGQNTFVGVNAGNFTMGSGATLIFHGSYNTAIGYQTLYSNTTGYYNTANGVQALSSNTTGSYNTANGRQALFFNTTGHSNTANGVQALFFNTTGHSNTANGVQALSSNTTGNYNTANGKFAGQYVEDGITENAISTHSVYEGYRTKALASGDTNEIVIGSEATGNGSNSVTLGNDNIINTILKGNIGIGTTNPTAKLTIGGTPGTDGIKFPDGTLQTTAAGEQEVFVAPTVANTSNSGISQELVIGLANTSRSGTDTTYTKKKQITVLKAGTYTVVFTLGNSGGASYSYGKIYKNNVALGTERVQPSGTTSTYAETFTFAAGDNIQIYGKAVSGVTYTISNFSIQARNNNLSTIDLN
jgi:hypothetical protein